MCNCYSNPKMISGITSCTKDTSVLIPLLISLDKLPTTKNQDVFLDKYMFWGEGNCIKVAKIHLTYDITQLQFLHWRVVIHSAHKTAAVFRMRIWRIFIIFSAMSSLLSLRNAAKRFYDFNFRMWRDHPVHYLSVSMVIPISLVYWFDFDFRYNEAEKLALLPVCCLY